MEKKKLDFESFKKQATIRLKNGENLLGKDEVLCTRPATLKNSLSCKDLKLFMKDLQNVYKVTTINLAERSLDRLESNSEERYPKGIESWKKNWPRQSNYFQNKNDVRRIMYTTISLKASIVN